MSTAVSPFAWHELTTHNPKAARTFYGDLLGWTFQTMDLGPHGEYTLATSGTREVAGFAAGEGDAPAQWIPYLAVADVDAAAGRAETLGAQIEVPPSDIPNVGRFALAVDPQGARFALFCPA